MKSKAATVRAISQPIGNGRWKVLASRAGRGVFEIGVLTAVGNGLHEVTFPDGTKHDKNLNWDSAEQLLIFNFLQSENQKLNEKIATRAT